MYIYVAIYSKNALDAELTQLLRDFAQATLVGSEHEGESIVMNITINPIDEEPDAGAMVIHSLPIEVEGGKIDTHARGSPNHMLQLITEFAPENVTAKRLCERVSSEIGEGNLIVAVETSTRADEPPEDVFDFSVFRDRELNPRNPIMGMFTLVRDDEHEQQDMKAG